MVLSAFIQKCSERVEPLETASHLAWWNLATTGSEKYQKELEDLNLTLRKIFSSVEDYHFLKLHQQDENPLIHRQAQLLLLRYAQNQIPKESLQELTQLETELEALYTNFRPVLNGEPVSNNELKDLLVNSLDSNERQHAWEASKKIAEEAVEKIHRLVALRNAYAKKNGFANYYSMQLQLQELDEKWLFDLLGKLECSTQDLWKKYKQQLDETLSKKYGISPAQLMPWHYQDPFFQEAPKQDLDLDQFYEKQDIAEISQKFFYSIGLPVDDILARSDLYEREKKNQHAFCCCIDRKQNIRILCNLRSNEYWMSTQLHELGHAVYDKFIDQSLPYFLRSYAHICMTEAIAMLFGRLSKQRSFIQQYCKTTQDADSIDHKIKKQNAANLLVFTRWILVIVNFERALYQDQKINLNQLWWELVEQYQLLKRIPGRNKPDWAAKLHIACTPAYYQNYILGEIVASQLTSYAAQFPKNIMDPAAGYWLKNKLFRIGSKLPWEQTLEHATDEKLNLDYFLKDLERLHQ